MNFFIVFPFFLKHLANEEYMINSRPVASKERNILPSISLK